MGYEGIKVVECLDKYYIEKKATIINDGKVVDFREEEIPTQTANPGGDTK